MLAIRAPSYFGGEFPNLPRNDALQAAENIQKYLKLCHEIFAFLLPAPFTNYRYFGKKWVWKAEPVLQTVFFMLCYLINKKMHMLNASRQT